jgi:signal transduction histidine kinase
MRASKSILAVAWAALALLLWSPLLGIGAGVVWGWLAGAGALAWPDVGFEPARLAMLGLLATAATLATALALRRALDERLMDLAQTNFAAAVTHELRTPITTIRMYADMLREGLVADPSTRDRFLAGISQECARLDGLVEDVLTFSALSEGRSAFRPEAVAVDDLLDDALAAAAGELAASGLAVERDVPPGLAVLADRRAMARVLTNLLSNAAKYAASGGRLRLAAGRGPRGVAIEVRDFGPGIPRAERRRVFRPFYRVGGELTRGRPGTGLGLALVRHLVAAQGGTVTLGEAPDGPGARVTIALPDGGGR